MPSKHIQDEIWEKVREEFVRAVVLTKSGFKETEILNLLIKKGIEAVRDEDYLTFVMEKDRKRPSEKPPAHR
ncbi:hypothetical protein [Neisseria bacilliformis]|uniref:Uncharacterized protein n=1 Tax=Inoviridae sp. ctPjN3 TaxID=2826761 RepID=A0A8S5NGM5_9VIRU|nr:hypothetical protein [Neisseria bacilliformis]DAD93846.1 MAG TPA: hypothetical protein [Inoviridae sp. ctPjN3]